MPGEIMPGEMEYLLLGPLVVRRAGAVVPLAAGRQQVVLAVLLLRSGQLASPDELIDALWGPAPPSSARASLQNYVKRLRQALGPAGSLIVTEPGGYRIDVRPGELDVDRFEAALAAGRAAARAGSWPEAAGVLRDGLAQWRGEPMAGLDSAALAAREAPRLAELRWQALEARIEADLHAGRAADVIGELRGLVADQPLRERLHGLLMTALARAGRPGAALAAYADARRILRDELGAEPGPDLRAVRAQIRAGGSGPAAPAAPPATAVRFALPPDTAAFTGRDGELRSITSAVTEAAAGGGVVAIRAIGGMPGVGKTTLAVRAAHLLADRFPDRQLFISLHGHTPGQEPLSAGDALAGLLVAVGADPRALPGDTDGRAAMWRDRMAGQRALLVLDNAAGSPQVAPLLPGGPDCLVLVTSRRHLADLPGLVVPVLVEVLPPEQAAEMFVRLAPRAAAEPAGAVAGLAAMAGFLPLAISLLARVYNRHRSWSLADLAAETRASMLTLAAEHDSVAAAFEVSWQHLDPGQRDLLGLLGLHPGTTVDAWAAAALAGIPAAGAARLLDGLHGEGLLAETGYRRYGMHDLIRRYAAGRACARPAAGRAAATGRLLDYYQHVAARAQDLLPRRDRATPVPPVAVPPAEIPDLPGSDQALAWLRAERANLLACIDHAARSGLPARLTALTAAAAELLRCDGPWPEAIARHDAAIQAARGAGDRSAEAGALTDLAAVRRLDGDYPGAAAALARALEMYRDLGSRPGQAAALTELSYVRQLYDGGSGDGPAAILAEALAIYRDLGDRLGQASALWRLGSALQMTADYPAAAGALGEALAIYRDLGSRLGQASVLGILAEVRRLTGDYGAAAAASEQALLIFGDLGDRLGQANSLTCLGDVRQLTGDYDGAAEALGEALAIYRDLGSHLGQANALTCLGDLRQLTGDYDGAAEALGQALSRYRDLGDRLGQASAMSSLGDARRLAGDHDGAAAVLEQALAIYRDLEDQGGQAEALNRTGTVHLARGAGGRARDCHQRALDLARQISSPRDEAMALAGLGRCDLAAGHAAGRGLLRQAAAMLDRIGDAEAADIAAELAELAARPPPEPAGGRPGPAVHAR